MKKYHETEPVNIFVQGDWRKLTTETYAGPAYWDPCCRSIAQTAPIHFSVIRSTKQGSSTPPSSTTCTMQRVPWESPDTQVSSSRCAEPRDPMGRRQSVFAVSLFPDGLVMIFTSFPSFTCSFPIYLSIDSPCMSPLMSSAVSHVFLH